MISIIEIENSLDFSKVKIMSSQKLSFEITPQIQRYLREILSFNDEFFADDTKEIYTLQTYINGEKPSYRSESNNDKFWGYLKKSKIIEMIGKPNVELIKYKNQNIDLLIPSLYSFCILDIKPIKELLKKVDFEQAKEKQGQSKGKDIQFIELPEGTKWQDITIRFIDNNDNVEISTKKITRMASYQEMGFEDAKRKRPNLQWKLLQLLTMEKGELSWETNLNISIKERNNIKKRVQVLSDTLKEYFQIKEYPFYPYRKEGAYKIKINLNPSSSGQSESKVLRTHDNEDGISQEIRKHLEENAPSVYEKQKKYNDDY